MDLPNELLHMILGFLPNNEHWSKFRQSSVRIYSLPTCREVCARQVAEIREMKRYVDAMKRRIDDGLACHICLKIFYFGSSEWPRIGTCENCGVTTCEDCHLLCRHCYADTEEHFSYCRTCLDANPIMCCVQCGNDVNIYGFVFDINGNYDDALCDYYTNDHIDDIIANDSDMGESLPHSPLRG